MKRVVRTDKGTVILDTATDVVLYATPCKDKDPRFVRGTDMYVHRSKAGNIYYYLQDWAQWHAEEGPIRVVTQEEAIKFLQDRVGDGSGFPDERQMKLLEEYGLGGIFEETG
jgi:hypothetical protein